MQLEAPRVYDDAPRHSAPEHATEPIEAIVLPALLSPAARVIWQRLDQMSA